MEHQRQAAIPGDGARILIVDRTAHEIRRLEPMLEPDGYLCRGARSGSEALQMVEEFAPDLVLLDALMPGMDGLRLARTLGEDPQTAGIPVIMMSSRHDRRLEIDGLSAGAIEFLNKPVQRVELSIRVRNLLRLKEYSDFLDTHRRLLKLRGGERSAGLRESYLETIFALSRASRYKDEETGAHIRRISHYCRHLAEELGMDRLFCENIFYASPMHDIGKIGIPDHILHKPGPHGPDECAIMKQHVLIGANILGASTSPYLAMGAEIALGHHERWDGSGYPQGAAGEAIPLSARIMSICDVYDALRAQRPYKPPIEHVRALEIIARGDGRTRPEHFDPQVLDVFLRCAEQIRDIYEAHASE